ncbi:MAG: ROK family protein [Planctomycetota bacterium]
MPKKKLTPEAIVREMVVNNVRSRRDLCRSFGICKASASRMVTKLLEDGILEEGDKFSASRRGRRTVSLHLVPETAYLVGAELGRGRNALHACMIDCSDHSVVAEVAHSTDTSIEYHELLCQFCGSIREALSTSDVDPRKIVGLGIAMPGLPTGTVPLEEIHIHMKTAADDWSVVDLAQTFCELDLPVVGANTPYCMAEYERRYGLGRRQSSFINISIQHEGLGAVVYEGGRVLGEGTRAGELGHMRIDSEGPVCPMCKKKGCLATYVAGKYLPPEDRRHGPEWDTRLAECMHRLATGTANLVKMLPVDRVVVDGIYVDYAEQARPILTEAVADELGGFDGPVPEIRFGEKMDLKASLGAAIQAGDVFLEDYLRRNVFDQSQDTPRSMQPVG